jgi:hypothetical protein
VRPQIGMGYRGAVKLSMLAALDVGAVDYGCRVSVCRRCRSRPIAGKVVNDNDFVFPPPQKDAGMIFARRSSAAGQVSVDWSGHCDRNRT